MYSGELEVQAKRKALPVLQDEINRILNAGRVLSTLPNMLVKKDKAGIKTALEQISSIEEEVENLRRKITRDVADVGGLILNRDNILNTAYRRQRQMCIRDSISNVSCDFASKIFYFFFYT